MNCGLSRHGDYTGVVAISLNNQGLTVYCGYVNTAYSRRTVDVCGKFQGRMSGGVRIQLIDGARMTHSQPMDTAVTMDHGLSQVTGQLTDCHGHRLSRHSGYLADCHGTPDNSQTVTASVTVMLDIAIPMSVTYSLVYRYRVIVSDGIRVSLELGPRRLHKLLIYNGLF